MSPYIPTTVISQAGGAGALTLISDTLLAVDTASFDLTGISQAYKHLNIYAQLRGTDGAIAVAAFVRFNNDSSASYAYTYVGTTVTTIAGQTATSFGDVASAGATAGLAGALEVTIPNYTGSTFFKDTTAKTSYSATGVNNTHSNLVGGLWYATAAAITRITVFPSAGSWLAGSRLTLYGIS